MRGWLCGGVFRAVRSRLRRGWPCVSSGGLCGAAVPARAGLEAKKIPRSPGGVHAPGLWIPGGPSAKIVADPVQAYWGKEGEHVQPLTVSLVPVFMLVM